MGVLDSRVAIVTGGAGNLGSYISRLFVAQGASVVINDVNIEKGKALADELGAIFDPTDGSTFAGGRWSRGPSTSSAPSTRWRCWPGGYR
jgi:NAD(P)-dependent dehydrogenase (short-subunit alcohol dehydrogenase family)